MSDPTPPPRLGDARRRQHRAVVATVRDRTTRPLLLAGRAVVFGVLAAIVGVAAVVLLSIADRAGRW